MSRPGHKTNLPGNSQFTQEGAYQMYVGWVVAGYEATADHFFDSAVGAEATLLQCNGRGSIIINGDGAFFCMLEHRVVATS